MADELIERLAKALDCHPAYVVETVEQYRGWLCQKEDELSKLKLQIDELKATIQAEATRAKMLDTAHQFIVSKLKDALLVLRDSNNGFEPCFCGEMPHEEECQQALDALKAVGKPVGEVQQSERKTILRGLWNLLRAYAGGGMPPAITKGIKLACQNVGMSEDHIASAELGGDDPDFVKRETEKRKCDLCSGDPIDVVCRKCGTARDS